MNSNKLFSCTIIIVVKNNVAGLNKTLISILNQINKEFFILLIDGASTDGSLELAKKFKSAFNHFQIVSEVDRGVYNAMNKAIPLVNTEYLLYMNSGDIFNDNNTFDAIYDSVTTDYCRHDVYYGDSIIRYNNYDQLRIANITKNRFIHQSIIYRKCLHHTYGLYVDSSPITVSDYIFFSKINSDCFKKLDFIVSVNEPGGISDTIDSFRQYIFFNYLFKKISFSKLLMIFALHPMYKIFKSIYNKIIN